VFDWQTAITVVFEYTHRLNDKLILNEIQEKHNRLLIIVDVSALTGAFVGTSDEGSSRSQNVNNNQ